jgi:hypothetical protein
VPHLWLILLEALGKSFFWGWERGKLDYGSARDGRAVKINRGNRVGIGGNMSMVDHRRRYVSFVFILFGIAAGVVFAVMPTHSHAQDPGTAPSGDVTALRRQRVETLQRASSVAHQLYANGQLTGEEVFRVDRLLLDAQLESAIAREDRAKLLQAALDVARRQEDLASQHSKAGLGSTVAAMEATADRLRVEIQLAEITAK